MPPSPFDPKDYISELGKRSKRTRVYRNYQLVGLEISQMLGDEEHKSLYIKMAKTHDPAALMRLAKDVCERKNIKNRGAYFMHMVKRAKENAKD